VRRELALTAAGVLLALLCGASHGALQDHRVVPARELPLHKPTGITFPATAGTLKRQWVHEKLGNPRSVRVGYGANAWIEIAPSGDTAAAKLASLKRSILLRHAATAVTEPASVGRGLFLGWKTAILEHRFEGDAPKGLRGQPRRDFIAARRCGKYVLGVRAWSLDAGNKESLRQLGRAVREIFADPGADPGRAFACT
jgi:hypothetical protein